MEVVRVLPPWSVFRSLALCLVFVSFVFIIVVSDLFDIVFELESFSCKLNLVHCCSL